MALDRSALICDLAETYGIYDYRSLPIRTVATLAVGLRNNARIKMKMRGAQVPGDSSFWLSMTIDRITDVLSWFGAYKDNPRPTPAIELWLGDLAIEEKTGAVQGFSSPEEFEAAMERYKE